MGEDEPEPVQLFLRWDFQAQGPSPAAETGHWGDSETPAALAAETGCFGVFAGFREKQELGQIV
jgi:hypothetical protein